MNSTHPSLFSKLHRFLACATLLAMCGIAAGADEYAPGIVLVKYRAGTTPQIVGQLAARHGLALNRMLTKLGVRRYQIPAGQNELVIARLLASYGVVEFAEPDYIRRATGTPNDALFAFQWDMLKMGLPTVWDTTVGSTDVVAAVIDTGIDLAHPDLVAALWINPGEIKGNNQDDDHNGYVDDYNGYDFAGNGPLPLPAAEDPIPNDTVGHGTHVSGTIAAQQGNSIGISGVAPRTRIMAVKVLGGFAGTGYSSDIVEGITYAVDNGAHVINMSLGGTSRSQTELDAVKYAWAHNVFIAAAAGNSGDAGNPIEYPSSYPFTLSVGATDIQDLIASFSTHNAFVEVSGPGVDIMSTVPGGYEQADWSGTSMATPHVTGMAALLNALHPGIAVWEVRAMIQDAIVDRGTAGWDQFFGYGRVNAAALIGMPRPNPAALRILTPNPGSKMPAGSIPAVVWNPVNNASNYRLSLKFPAGNTKSATVNATSFVGNPAMPMPKGAYLLTVDALNSGAAVIASDSVNFTR